MVRPDNAPKRDQARIIAATGQADIDAQQRALAEGGQEALYREQVAQQLAANRVNLERRKEAGQISQTQYDQQLKQQQDMVERNSQFYGEALKSSVDAGVSRHRASDRASGQIGESHRFYREIGYSQYAGRYAPFEIPEGHEVRGITEGPEGLNITFVDPVAEQQAKSQAMASDMFYKGIGFGQYAGKYAPFKIPKGYKVKNITEGPSGLNIEFYDPVAEQQAKSQAMVSDMFYKSIGFGQFGGKYAPFEVPKGLKVKNITEGPTGLNIEFYDPEFEASQAASHAFFSSIGYSQFAGKYAPFEVPAGHTVHSITESESGLNITFLGPQVLGASTPTSQAAAPELSNIEKVLMGDLTIDFLSDTEKQELYMMTSSQSMAPIMAFRNFAIQQKQDSKDGFTDTLKEGKTAAAATSAGGILKSIELAEKSVAKAAAATTSGLIVNPLGSDPSVTPILKQGQGQSLWVNKDYEAKVTESKLVMPSVAQGKQIFTELKNVFEAPSSIAEAEARGLNYYIPASEKSEFIAGAALSLTPQFQKTYTIESKAKPDLGLGATMSAYSQGAANILTAAAGENPVVNALIGNARGLIDFGAGVTATVESSVYGTGALFGSAKKSLETGKLQYSPGFEAFGVKTPVLMPTTTGVVVSGILGDSGGVEFYASQSYGYRMGSALGEAGLMAVESVAFGAALGKVSRVVRGAKATELKSATEFSRAVTEGQKTTIKRFTQFETKTVRLKGADLDYYSRYNLQTLQKARLDMAGTQNIKTVKLDVAGFPEEITVFGKAAESTRSANPVLAALKGERLAYGKVGQYTRGISKTTIKAQGPIKTAGKTIKPSTTLNKSVVLDKSFVALREPTKLSARKFTTIKASGLADDLEYLAAAKAVPDDLAQQIYKRLGGSYRQFVDGKVTPPKNLSGPMKPLRDSISAPKPGENIAKIFETSQAIKKQGTTLREYIDITRRSSAMKTGTNQFFRSTTKTATKLETKPQTLGKAAVTLERAIVSVETKTKTAAAPIMHFPSAQKTELQKTVKEKQPYPTLKQPYIQRLRQREDEEQVYLSYPGQQLRVETPTKTVVTPVLTPRSTYLQTSTVTLPTMTQIRTQPVTAPTKEKTKTPTLIRPITTPKTAPLTTPVITPWQTPKTAPYSTPFFGQTQKLTPKQMTTTALQFSPPATTKTLTAPVPFTPPFSHQKPRKRTRGIFGLWRKQDNPVKTSAAMLKTFGLLGSKKPVKSKRKKSRR